MQTKASTCLLTLLLSIAAAAPGTPVTPEAADPMTPQLAPYPGYSPAPPTVQAGPPVLEVEMSMFTTGDFQHPLSSTNALVLGGIIWQPGMPVAGRLRLGNYGPGDYTMVSEQFDVRRQVTVVGAMHGSEHVPAEKLPPLSVDFYSINPEERKARQQAKELVQKAGGNKATLLRFVFQTPADYQWQPGLWVLTLKLDLQPGLKKPKLVSAPFRIQPVVEPEDRLNVLWYQCVEASREEDYLKALKLLNEMIALPPKNPSVLSNLIGARSSTYFALNNYRKSLADLQQMAELRKRDRAAGTTTGSHLNKEGLSADEAYNLQVQTIGINQTLKNEAFLDSLSSDSPSEHKEQAFSYLRKFEVRFEPYIQGKLLQAFRRLKRKECLPAVLELMNAPLSTTVNNSYRVLSADETKVELRSVRAEAWQTLLQLWPESKAVNYDPEAPAEQRKVAIEQLRQLLQ